MDDKFIYLFENTYLLSPLVGMVVISRRSELLWESTPSLG